MTKKKKERVYYKDYWLSKNTGGGGLSEATVADNKAQKIRTRGGPDQPEMRQKCPNGKHCNIEACNSACNQYRAMVKRLARLTRH